MRTFILLSILELVFTVPFSRKQTGAVRQEYCMSETFHAQCARNEVIVMTQAQYGRMRIGRCVVADLGYLGCATDALPFLDATCSGVNECSFLVPSEDLDKTKPCLQELRSYLEVSYKCMQVAMAEKDICESSPSLKLLSTAGYLSSYVAAEYSCGSLTAPWRVEVLPGQTINITLMDFTRITSGWICNPIGYTTNLSGGYNKTICQSGSRDENVYSLAGQSVLIYMITNRMRRDNALGHFLLKYQVTGCADLHAPEFAWYRREERDLAIVGCHHSDKSWHLKCVDNHWVGVLGNCTHRVLAATDMETSWLSSSHAVIIIVIIGIALLIAILVLACGFYCASKATSSLKLKHQAFVSNRLTEVEYDKQSRSYSDKPASHRASDYAHIWDASLTESHTAIKPPSDSDYGSQSYMSGSQLRSIDSDCVRHGSLS